MLYIIENEGPLALFKGIAPQITKGILVQGVLMMIKERSVGRSPLYEKTVLTAEQNGDPFHCPLCLYAQDQIGKAAERG